MLFSGYIWSKVSKTVFKFFLWPLLLGATLFLAQISKGGTLLEKKYFLKIFRGLLVLNERLWLADYKTVWIFCLWCFLPEKSAKIHQKEAFRDNLVIFAIFHHIFWNISGKKHHKQKIQTVLESANHNLSFDTNKPLKIFKKYFFSRRVPPFDIWAKKSVAPRRRGDRIF